MKTEEQTELTDNESSSEMLDGEENAASTFKPFLLGIAGLAVVMAILILLPMLLTFLSSGDARAPSQIHHADPLGKRDPNTTYKSL